MNVDCVHYVQGPIQFKPMKSKDFYVKFIQLLTTDSAVITGYSKVIVIRMISHLCS